MRSKLAALGFVALSAAFLVGCGKKAGSDFKLQKYEEVGGYKLGEAVMDAIPDPGLIVVLRAPSEVKDQDDPTAGRFRGLQDALPGYTFAHAGPDPVGFGAPSDDFHVFSSGDLADQIVDFTKQQDKPVAVVSLLFEFPALGKKWSGDMPPIFGFTAGPSQEWARAMNSGWLKALVRPKQGASSQDIPPKGASTDEAFAKRFEMVLPDALKQSLDGPR